MKQCHKCKQWLDESCFSTSRGSGDGLFVYCKECHHQMRCTTDKGRQIWENKKLAKRGLKQCFRCQKVKPLDKFYPHKKHGHRSVCIECSLILRQGEEHRREALAEKSRLGRLLERGLYWCNRCKETKPVDEFYFRYGKPRTQCMACCLEAGKQHYADTIDYQRERSIVKYQVRKDAQREWQRQYNQTPKGRAVRKAVEMRRRARELNAEHEDYTDEIEKILVAGLFKCRYCGLMFSAEDLTLDHILALSKGGADKWGNVAPCCMECNNAKLDKDVKDFDAHAREDIIIQGLARIRESA